MDRVIDIDWPAYTSELLTLLDLIEMETDCEHAAHLTLQRFEIAKRHGFTIERGGLTTGMIQ